MPYSKTEDHVPRIFTSKPMQPFQVTFQDPITTSIAVIRSLVKAEEQNERTPTTIPVQTHEYTLLQPADIRRPEDSGCPYSGPNLKNVPIGLPKHLMKEVARITQVGAHGQKLYPHMSYSLNSLKGVIWGNI